MTETVQKIAKSPNHSGTRLRRWRVDAELSQSQFAELVHKFGLGMGLPNGCTKRLVQKWESGEHCGVRPNYAAILNKLTGMSIEELRNRKLTQSPDTYMESPDGVLDMIDMYIAQMRALRLKVLLGKND